MELKQANINETQKDGRTPLHLAAKEGHKDVVALLLAAKANLEHEDENKQTPLHWAARNGHKDVVSLLLSAKANLEHEDKYKQTPLHWAAKQGHKDVVSLLLKANAKFDHEDEKETPIDWATTEGHKDVVSLLLAAKANLERQQDYEQRSMQLAAKEDHKNVVAFLPSAYANLEHEDDWKETPMHWAAEEGDKVPVLKDLQPSHDYKLNRLKEDIRLLPIWSVNPSDPTVVQPLSMSQNIFFGIHGHKAEVIANTAKSLVAWGLTRKCVNQILEMAGFVVEYRTETLEYRQVHAPADEEYLRCEVNPFDHNEVKPTHPIAIVVEIVSRDQGWADEATDLNGTYHGCYSWSEGRVWNSRNEEASERFTMCYNLRAEPTLRRHIQCISDPKFLNQVTMGAIVTLHLCAQYSGLQNIAKYGRISILYAAGLSTK